MTYLALLAVARQQPLLDTATLVALGEKPATIAVQLSRWVKAGKLVQLRRGLYILPAELRTGETPLMRLANLMLRPSYVSLEHALAHHELIPESVPLVQSVTTRRPAVFRTPVGEFRYHYLSQRWFFGYEEIEVPGGRALVARPEKALLDLFHLLPGEWSKERLNELRLQNLEALDVQRMRGMAARVESPRILRAVANVATFVEDEIGISGESR